MSNTEDRKERVEIIRRIQEIRGSQVIVYCTGDRSPFVSMISDDAVRPFYDHLLALPPRDEDRRTIDLFLYSRGGDVSVPWRVVSMIREFCDKFAVLIPYRAHSAATMISIGADEIVMGKKAELGPIDPTLQRAPDGGGAPAQISVEDVTSYVSFMRERAGITDQAALSAVVSQLAAHLTPLTLGSANRTYSHIRLVARKLMAARAEKADEAKLGNIIEALTEKMYSHGHAIGRREATELGLPVVSPDPSLEDRIWELYCKYETMLSLTTPLDMESHLRQQNRDQATLPDLPQVVIESAERCSVWRSNFDVNRKRNIPPNPQININLTLGVPPGLQQQPTPPQLHQTVQQLLQQITQILPEMVMQELVRQSPVVGFEVKQYGGRWTDN